MVPVITMGNLHIPNINQSNARFVLGMVAVEMALCALLL